MAQNKHKIKRRIICILCASIIALYALAVPIGAVVNSSQVGLGQTGLYGESTFPFTVGFVQRDDALDRNYIFATEIGGYGQSGNQTVEGSDIFYWNYPDTSDEESSAITYIQGDKVWLDGLHYTDLNPQTGAVGSYKGGYSTIDLQYNTVSPDFEPTTESIIFKANNVYYNPIWLAEEGGQTYKFKDDSNGANSMIPTVYLPTLDSYTTKKFVGAYSVEATVIDMNGERHWIQYSQPIDTSISIVGISGIPFIHPDYLKQFINPEDIAPSLSGEVVGSNSTICIEEYRGYLDVDYYEYVEPEATDELSGTWVLNSNIVRTLGSPDFSMMSSSVNTTNISGSMNIYVKTAGSFISAPIESLFISSLEDFNNTTANQVVFRLSSYVNSRPYYNKDIFFRTGVGHVFEDLAWPVSGDGVVSYLYTGANWSDNSNYDSVFSIDSDNGILMRTFSILDEGLSTDEYNLILSWLQANATKQASAATVADEGTWEKVTDTELLNKCLVSYPLYDTSAVTDPSLSAQTWLAYPTAEKMLSGVISMHQPDEIIIPDIDEDMYKDYTGWLGTAVKGFFDTPLLGGMSLGVIVGVIVMFGCAIALLKIFAGG